MSRGLTVTEDWLREAVRSGRVKVSAETAVPVAHTKSNIGNEPAPKNESEKAHPKLRIHYHSRRRRLTDPDGVFSKWCTDGLVLGGLLPDDGPEIVESVTYSQEKIPPVEQEETIVTIVEVP